MPVTNATADSAGVVTATVTRTELGLSDLDLAGAAYSIRADSLLPGAIGWRREYARSPYVDGAIEIGAVKDIAGGSIVVDVAASTHTGLRTAIDTLLDAFTEQRSYTLTVTWDSASWAWTCRRADYSVAFDAEFEIGRVAAVTLSFPRSPTPAAGPF